MIKELSIIEGSILLVGFDLNGRNIADCIDDKSRLVDITLLYETYPQRINPINKSAVTHFQATADSQGI